MPLTFKNIYNDRTFNTGGVQDYNIEMEEGQIYRPYSWNDLSIADKAEMMRVAIDNGITNLSDIKQKYNEFAGGGKVTKNDTEKAKVDLTPLDLAIMYDNNKQYGNRYIDTTMLRQIDNYLLDRNVGLPQRQAITYTIQQEGNTIGSHGNGAYGLVGWRGDRARNLPNTVKGQSKKLYDEIYGEFNADNWNHGGRGSGYNSGRDAQKAFQNAKTVEEATKAFNFGYVRPPYSDRVNRTNTSGKIFKKKAYGGYLIDGINTFVKGGDLNISNSYPIGGLLGLPSIAQAAANTAINATRQRLYNNITPFGYQDPINRTVNAVVRNNLDNERVGENQRINEGDPAASALDAVWATYLNIPQNKRRSVNLRYDITRTPGGYYSFNSPDLIIDFDQDLSSNGLYSRENRKDNFMNRILGNYTEGLGRDKKGDYIYYSDSRLNPDGTPDISTGWDINPFATTLENPEEASDKTGQYGQDKTDTAYKIGNTLLGNVGDISMGIGKPVPIYDKIYLDRYYGVPKKDWGGHYLPEVTVTGNKHGHGGPLIEAANTFVNGGPKGKTNNSKNSWYNQHQKQWYGFLIGKGVNSEDARRLSGFFTAQDDVESAGGTSSAARQKNNFGGMQRNGKNITYPSVQAYMEDKWGMMNRRFAPALNARSIDEYATILGNPNNAGKGYLYYVTDKVKYNPNDPTWRAAQTQHMHNYINAMRSRAGMSGRNFQAPTVTSAPSLPALPEHLSQPLPATLTEAQSSVPAFMPSNPQAFFAPIESFQQPVQVEPVQPVVEQQPSPYDHKEIERQERAQGWRNFNMLMGLLGNRDNNDFLSTVSMLAGSNT